MVNAVVYGSLLKGCSAISLSTFEGILALRLLSTMPITNVEADSLSESVAIFAYEERAECQQTFGLALQGLDN